MALLTIPSGLSKGSPFTVTLDKSALFGLMAVVSNSHFSNQANVATCLVKYKSDVQGALFGQTRLMRFDLSQATPGHTMSVSSGSGDLFEISQILLVDNDGAVFAVPASEFPALNLNFSSGGGTGITFLSIGSPTNPADNQADYLISWSSNESGQVDLEYDMGMPGMWMGFMTNIGTAVAGSSGSATVRMSYGYSYSIRLKINGTASSQSFSVTAPSGGEGGGGGGGPTPTVDSAVNTYGDWDNLAIDVSSLNRTGVSSITLYMSVWNGSDGPVELGLYKNGVLQESATAIIVSGNYSPTIFNFASSYSINQGDFWQLKFISRPYFTSVWLGSNYSPSLNLTTLNRGTFSGVAYEVNGSASAFTPGPAPMVLPAIFDISLNEQNAPTASLSWSGGTQGADVLLYGNLYGNYSYLSNLGSSTSVTLTQYNTVFPNSSQPYSGLNVASLGGLSSMVALDDALLYGDSKLSDRGSARGLGSVSQIYGDWEGVNITLSGMNQTVQSLRLYGEVSGNLAVNLTKNGVVQESAFAVGSSSGLWYNREPLPIDIVFTTSHVISDSDVWKLEFENGNSYYLATNWGSGYALNTSNRGPQGFTVVETNFVDQFAAIDQTDLPSLSGVTMKRLALGTGPVATSGTISVDYCVAYKVDLSENDKGAFVAGTSLANGIVGSKTKEINGNSLVGYMQDSRVGECRQVKIAARTMSNGVIYQTFYIYIKRTA